MRTQRILRLAGVVARHHGADIRLARRAIGTWGALQRTWELASLIGVVRELRPRTVVEIGTFRGGTLACWADTAHPHAHIICVDLLDPSYGIDEVETHAAHLRGLVRTTQRLTFLGCDSQDEGTAAAVRRALAGAAIDFLWIDGDHRDAGVRRDFALYSPLVSPGGAIAFHDIHPNPDFPDTQSHLLWRELKGQHRVREFIDQDQPGGAGMGIGVLYLRTGAGEPGARSGRDPSVESGALDHPPIHIRKRM
jgi:cephalosporin hydroxylase